MSELSFEDLLKQEEMISIYNGQIVEGTVIDVKEDEIVLNINYKADGIITKREYSNSLDINCFTILLIESSRSIDNFSNSSTNSLSFS